MALLSLAQPGRFHDVGKSGVGRRVKLIITVIKIIENLAGRDLPCQRKEHPGCSFLRACLTILHNSSNGVVSWFNPSRQLGQRSHSLTPPAGMGETIRTVKLRKLVG